MRKPWLTMSTLCKLDSQLADCPDWLTRLFRRQPDKPPTIVDRAHYLRAQLAKLPCERLLHQSELDATPSKIFIRKTISPKQSEDSMPIPTQTEQTTSHPIKRAFWWILFLSLIAFGAHEIYLSYSDWQKNVKTQQPAEEVVVSLKAIKQKGEASLQWMANHDKEQSAQFQSQAHQPEKSQYVEMTEAEGLEELPPAVTVREPPAEEPDEQPLVPIEPGQFIRDYYTAISNQQYEKTWLMLSNHFKEQFHCCHSDGSYQFNTYFKWWNSIQKVKTLRVKVKASNKDTATIRAKLRYYFKKRGRIVDDAHTFKLVTDTEEGWLIDEQH